MTMLPNCNIYDPMPNHIKVEFKSNTDEYNEFIDCVKSMINTGCYAFTINNEIIYNMYESKSFRDRIIDDTIKTQIINDLRNSVLIHILRDNKDAIIEIYMWPIHSYKYIINYSNETKKFSIERFISEAFDKAYPLLEKDLKTKN